MALMSKVINLLIQPISILSMSLAWLFGLGCLLSLGAALSGRPSWFVPTSLEACLFFGLQAGSVVLLEFDHWRAYYGSGALLRELSALLGTALVSWLIVRFWPAVDVLEGTDSPNSLQIAVLLGLLALILFAPYLATQSIYLLLGEPLNFQRCLRLYYQRQWAKIIKTFEPLVKRRPNALRPKLILAAAYFNLRQFDRARRLYEQMLERDPHTPGAWQGLAELAFTRGAWEEAAGHYTQALTFASSRRRGFIHIGLGIAFYKLDRSDEAAAHLKKALSYPLSATWRPIAAYTLMRSARSSGDTRTAERALQSLTLPPRARKQFMDYWQAVLTSSSSPLNSDYRAAVNLIDQLSWGE